MVIWGRGKRMKDDGDAGFARFCVELYIRL